VLRRKEEGLDHRMAKTTECNKCGQTIWFNWDAESGEPGRSDSGRLVPLEVKDNELLDERHDCPESDYNRGRGTRGGGGGGQRTANTSRTSSSGSGISSSNKDFEPNAAKMILANGLDALGKIERGNQSLESVTRTLFQIEENVTKIMKHLNIIDPNNDDGDSQREVSESDFTYDDPDNNNVNNRS
jgi:hypothetical protein